METDLTNLRLSQDVFKLIQPDLLSVDELIIVLKERGVRPGLLSHQKEKLVALFRRVALPLPQRELRDNYRGRLFMKLRRKFERKTNCETKPLAESVTQSFTIGVVGNSVLSKEELKKEMVCDRLKPPPDQINYERKKIRLNSGSSLSKTHKNSLNSDLDQIVIKRKKPSDRSTDFPSENKVLEKGNSEQKHKNLPESFVSSVTIKEDCNGDQIKSAPKKVSLKRNHLLSKTSTSISGVLEKEISESDSKKKPTTITWP